jgi:hypothetical protein
MGMKTNYRIELKYGRYHACDTISQVVMWLAENARETGVIPTWLGWNKNNDGTESCALQFNGELVGRIDHK